MRRELRGGGNIGVRLELDDVDSNLLIAVRALDYRYSISDRLAVGAFLGAARLDLATPAHGYYLGGGVQLKELVRGWDLSIDLRLGDKLARDNLLAVRSARRPARQLLRSHGRQRLLEPRF